MQRGWILLLIVSLVAVSCSATERTADPGFAPHARLVGEPSEPRVANQVASATEEREQPPAMNAAASVNEALGRGINFGNSLEAPREGDWGAALEVEHFRLVAEAGFDHIRLPVSWAEYADTEPPFTIPTGVDPAIVDQPYSTIWERVDWAIDQAEANDLMIIVNMHHYDEAQEDPLAHWDRIIGMWEQIAPHYADAGDHVVFELFNEPYLAFYDDPDLWNELLADLLAVVRETNPTRPVLIGPAGFNRIDFLEHLVLPDDDHLIATVHLYEPVNFTHQGAEWLEDIPQIGVPWATDTFGWTEGLYDRSWDSRVITEDGKLRVDFHRQWAGFSVDYIDPVRPTELRFQVEGEGSLRIGCRAGEVDELDQSRIESTESPQDFVIDLSGCSDHASGFSVMNQSEEFGPVRLSSVEFCSEARGCQEIVTDAESSLRRWVERAGEWSVEMGVPVHIGEFGAFAADGQVPIEDRAAWTRTVVDEATRQGLSFAYWEFHAGYAAYDLEARQWNAPLLDALLG